MNYKYILLEGQVEDLVARYPKLQGVYDAGLLDGINPAYVMWIAKQNEPPKDVIDLVNKFEKNKQRLSKKDINQYSSEDLALELEQFGAEEKQKTFSSSKEEIRTRDTTNLGQFGPWTVVMPHTTESSCYWANKGGQISWCTARTQSQNLFLSYVARKAKIILYYLINTEEGPENKNYKVSIGFQDGKPALSGQSGGLTVNSKNEGLDKKALKKILGEHYESIMSTLTQHAGSIGEKHPAKREIDVLAADQKKLAAKLKTFKDEDSLKDFIEIVINNPNRTSKVIKYVFSEYPDEDMIQRFVYDFTARDLTDDEQEILDFVYKKYPDSKAIQRAVASSSNSPEELIKLADKAVQSPQHKSWIVEALLRMHRPNKAVPNEVLIKFIKSPQILKDYYELIAMFIEKVGAPVEIFSILLDEMEKQDLDSKYIPGWDGERRQPTFKVIATMADNPNVSLEMLEKYATKEPWLKMIAATNTGPAAAKLLPVFATDENVYVRKNVANNPNTPPEILLTLSKDEDKQVRKSAKQNPNFVDVAPVSKSSRKKASTTLEHRVFERLLREARRLRW